MALLFPGMRQLLKLSGGVGDKPTQKALRNLEDWADQIVRRLSTAEGSTGGVSLPIAMSDVTGLVAALAAKVASTRLISTTSPLAGGGDLSADRTLTVADNSTSSKGVVAQAPNDTSKFWRGDATWATVNFSTPFPIWGTGADGDLDFDGVNPVVLLNGTTFTPSGGNYTVTRNVFAHDIHVSTGVTVTVDGWQVCATGTLSGSGTFERNGNNASGATAGAALGTGSLPGATAGGAGGTSSTASAGSNSATAPHGFVTGQAPAAAGGGGTPGGAGNIGGGGSGGNGSNGNSGARGGSIATHSEGGSWDVILKGRSFGAVQYTGASGGGGGASGSSGSTSRGGGGGGGGGWMVFLIRNSTFSGTIEARGGNGAAGISNGAAGVGGGGGGGGGGGWITWVCGKQTTSPTFDVSGGAGGAGGVPPSGTSGGNGGNGGDGFVFQCVLT